MRIKQEHKGYVIPAEYALSKRPSFLSTANAIAVKAMAFRNTTLELQIPSVNGKSLIATYAVSMADPT